MSRPTGARAQGVCSVCGELRTLQTRQPARCNPCYQAWSKAPEQVAARLALHQGPAPLRCACGRPAHPATGTCYRCGGNWPDVRLANIS